MLFCVYVVFCPTSVAVVKVGELVPLVVLNEAEQWALDIGPHLDDKLLDRSHPEGSWEL